MARRPLCLACLLLMLAMAMADLLGMPLIRGNPLPKSVSEYLKKHPGTTICGEVERCAESENSKSVYLKNVYFIYQSKKIPIKNVRVFLKNQETFSKAKSVANVRSSVKGRSSVNADKGLGDKCGVSVDTDKGVLYKGMMVRVKGRLEEIQGKRNPGEFDSRQYYACQHIYYVMKKAVIKEKSSSYSVYGQFLVDLQQYLGDILYQAAGKEGEVLKAIVLGDKTGLEDETKLRYQMGGILHILAISGLHISIIGMGFYRFLKKCYLGNWTAGMIALVFMIQYGMMTGGSVSVMRAVCMFLMAAGARILGRIYDLPTALAASAVLILLESPAYLYSSGFLLSFSAVFGAGIIYPYLEKKADKSGKKENRKTENKKTVNRKVKAVCKKGTAMFLASLGVQLTMLPVSLYFFGEVSVAGLVLNLLVIPSVAVVLVSGLAGMLVGCFWMTGAKILIFPGKFLLWLYEMLCGAAGSLSIGNLRIPVTWVAGQPKLWQIVLYYLILGTLLFLYSKKGKWRTGYKEKYEEMPLRMIKISGIVYRAILVAGVVVSLLVIRAWPSPDLQITCLDVGQGDGIVIQTPEGKNYLIDGGSSSKTSTGRYQMLPFLKSRGISRIDGIFISHVDEDHISGVREILELQAQGLTSVYVSSLYLPKWQDPPEKWSNLEELGRQAGVQIHTVKRGDILQSGKLKLCFLAPEDGAKGENVNEDGMVIQLEYAGFSGLFTGDIGEATEKDLLPYLKDVDFLKVGHHGSKYSTCSVFLEKIKPENGVISCSETNTYGHPSSETIQRLREHGCEVAYTMMSGAVTVYTDGKHVKMEGFFSSEL